MRRVTPRRHDHLDALFTCPLIHDIAHDLGNLGQKPRRHPIALHLAFAAMSRLYGSANQLDNELADPYQWAAIVDRYNRGAAEHPNGVTVDINCPVLINDTHRHVRDHLTTGDTIDDFSDIFTEHSVAIARSVGLLNPDGPGSRTHPHPSRTIYGDGTIVRPLYGTAAQRVDPDADHHNRFDGRHLGNDLVAIAVRGPEPHRRVILAAGRVHTPGHEADTAVDLIRQVHNYAGDGIHAVVYDGAMRGIHHETLMTELGLIVLNKVHPATNKNGARTWRTLPLGTWTHDTKHGTCTHTLVVHNGAVHDSTLTAKGTLTIGEPLTRQQVRRYHRGRRNPGYRFTLGVTVPCAKGNFTAWISPHPQPDDTNHRRPDQMRLIPPTDPDFNTLYGLRNDSESINNKFKNTLPHRRAASLGWKRQLLDLIAWSLLTNTYAWHQHRSTSPMERSA